MQRYSQCKKFCCMNFSLQRVSAENSWAGEAYSPGKILYCTYTVVVQTKLVRLIHIELFGCHSILDLYGTLGVRLIEHCSTPLKLLLLIQNFAIIYTRIDHELTCSRFCSNVFVLVVTVHFLLLDQLVDKFLIFTTDVVNLIHLLTEFASKCLWKTLMITI